MELTGVDIPISTLRDAFASRLWTTITPSIFYSRVFRNLNNQGDVIGEVYVGEREYKEVHFDDTYAINVFFDPSDTIENVDPQLQTTREVGIVFAVNVEKIYPSLAYRALEEIYRDVLTVINSTHSLQVVPQNIVSGLNAYADLYTENIKQYDMQPYHTFRVNTLMNVAYGCSTVAQNIIPSIIAGFDYPLPIILT